eukprot:278701_1
MAQPSATYIEDKPLTPTPTPQSSALGRKPRILVVNDDGFRSHGLKQLALALEEIADVVVVSTIDNQIHPSFSITIQETIRAKQTEVWGQNILVYAVSGFPMNCLKYAYGHVIPNVLKWDQLDLVIAGINKGRNVGTDLLYSGTMSLACAARFGNESFMRNNQTPKAIAISLCPPSLASTSSLQSLVDWNFDISVQAALQITKLALQSDQTNNIVWNVNIPQNPKQSDANTFYWAVTKPATLKYDPDALITITKDDEKLNFRDFVINPPDIFMKHHDIMCGSDVHALRNSIISISPIEVSPALHTPLHATNNLINFMTNHSAFYTDNSYVWEISVNIRPLQSIVLCLEHWLQLKDKSGSNGNDHILLHTYTLYLERDIKICADKQEFERMLSNRFGWSETQQKFTRTLEWTQLQDLYNVLHDIQVQKSTFAQNRTYNVWTMVSKAAIFTAASMAIVATASFIIKRSRETHDPN